MAVGARTGENALKVKYPGGRTYMFRVELKDKHGTPYSLSRPGDFLSTKALERRNRQHLRLDSTDLPVNPAYVNEIRSMGVDVVSSSKWNNTVLVRSRHLSKLKSVALLGCVKSVRKVWTSPARSCTDRRGHRRTGTISCATRNTGKSAEGKWTPEKAGRGLQRAIPAPQRDKDPPVCLYQP